MERRFITWYGHTTGEQITLAYLQGTDMSFRLKLRRTGAGRERNA
jgi:hypothetical protein